MKGGVIMNVITMVKRGVDKLANSKAYCKAVSIGTMAVVSMASLSVTASASGEGVSSYDVFTDGLPNVVKVFKSIWELCTSNPILATICAAALVPVGCGVWKSMKRAFK